MYCLHLLQVVSHQSPRVVRNQEADRHAEAAHGPVANTAAPGPRACPAPDRAATAAARGRTTADPGPVPARTTPEAGHAHAAIRATGAAGEEASEADASETEARTTNRDCRHAEAADFGEGEITGTTGMVIETTGGAAGGCLTGDGGRLVAALAIAAVAIAITETEGR